MKKYSCEWCNQESDLSAEIEGGMDESSFICPGCLIPLLPKTLSVGEREQETANEDGERRRAERYPLTSVAYLSSSEGKRKIAKILLLDISDSGMKIQLQEALKENEKITLGFMSDDLIYKAIGIARHLTQVGQDGQTFFQAGIELTGIHQELRVLD